MPTARPMLLGLSAIAGAACSKLGLEVDSEGGSQHHPG